VRLLLVSVAAICACGVPDGEYFGQIPAHDPTHLRWCNQGEPDHLDPGLASSTVSQPLVNELFDGLARFDAHALPEPSLARSWDAAPDLKTFTFHLRDDARWSDGHPVDAYDVAYSVLRVLHPLTASPNSDNLQMVANSAPFQARTVFVVRATGAIVTTDAAPAVDVTARTSSHDVQLRDLGGGMPYATVPAGTTVSLVMTTGGRATWPSPDGQPWAYVYWPRDQAGVYGWVPLNALDGEPNGDAQITPQYRARDLLYSTDAVGITVPDAHTILFTMTDPAPSFLAQTPSRAMRTVPIAQVSRWPRSWDRPAHIVTDGPFDLVAWSERDRVELVRSKTYWDRANVKLARITAYSIDDQAATTNLYYTGHCDATAANNVPSTYLPALNGELTGKAFKDYDVHPYLGVYFVWANTQQLSNRHLRRALALAIDRTVIPRFTHGGELPTAQLTPGTPIAQLSDADLAACGVPRTQPGYALVAGGGNCYVPPPGLDYDLDAARKELALARAEGGVPAEPIEYRYNAGSEAHKQIAEYLQAEWRAIGLDVRVTSEEWNSLLEDTRAHKFQLARFGNIGSSPFTESDFLPIFRCASPDNRGAYCSKDFERLMDEVPPILDLRARNAKLREAEAVMIGDAPVIPLYVYSQKHLIKPYVHGYEINLYDQPPLAGIWLDP
jgi:ABC-type oligopeptide transport system substrate-binding subunit